MSDFWLVCSGNKRLTYFNNQLYTAARYRKYNCSLVPDIEVLLSANKQSTIQVANRLVAPPDFIVHQSSSAAVLRHLSFFKSRMLNSCQSMLVSNDKFQTYELLHANQIPIPVSFLLRSPMEAYSIPLSFPLVVKPRIGSLGRGVKLISSVAALHAHLVNEDEPQITQEYIHNPGRFDLRVYVLGDSCIGAIKRTAITENFRTNVALGNRLESVSISHEIEDLAVRATKLLGLDLAGVDILLDAEEKPYICELNSAPTFAACAQKAMGINAGELVLDYLEAQKDV